MTEELIGYVTGNINRDRIMKILESKGAEKSEVIAKRARIPLKTAGKILMELKEKGLVEQEGENFKLTSKGREIVREILKII
ncbi:MAG: winged helix-turn-helix domain-containing protein [Methanocellales archaeon]